MPQKSMPKKKTKTTVAKRKASKVMKSAKSVKIGKRQQLLAKVQQQKKNLSARTKAYLSKRPHRSFRRSYRRDYVRPLNLPGYWAFTNYVRKTLWENKRLFLLIALLYSAFTAIFVPFASQETYTQLSDLLKETGSEIFSGAWGAVGEASLLLTSGLMGNFVDANLSEEQKTLISVFSTIIAVLTWLTTVWLLRAILAGQKPKLRQGLYNAGAPIVPSFMLFAVLMVQLIPLGIGILLITAAGASGMLDGDVNSMLFYTAFFLVAMLSLYWITSTLFSFVIVTLPGMYPLQALKTASDLVLGRRLRILLRLLWLVFVLAIFWAVTLIPLILFDAWIKSVLPVLANVPLVPWALLIVGSFTVIWTASYIYLLYRKVVENDADSA